MVFPQILPLLPVSWVALSPDSVFTSTGADCWMQPLASFPTAALAWSDSVGSPRSHRGEDGGLHCEGAIGQHLSVASEKEKCWKRERGENEGKKEERYILKYIMQKGDIEAFIALSGLCLLRSEIKFAKSIFSQLSFYLLYTAFTKPHAETLCLRWSPHSQFKKLFCDYRLPAASTWVDFSETRGTM